MGRKYVKHKQITGNMGHAIQNTSVRQQIRQDHI